jgi:hypothetical protein
MKSIFSDVTTGPEFFGKIRPFNNDKGTNIGSSEDEDNK